LEGMWNVPHLLFVHGFLEGRFQEFVSLKNTEPWFCAPSLHLYLHTYALYLYECCGSQCIQRPLFSSTDLKGFL